MKQTIGKSVAQLQQATESDPEAPTSLTVAFQSLRQLDERALRAAGAALSQFQGSRRQQYDDAFQAISGSFARLQAAEQLADVVERLSYCQRQLQTDQSVVCAVGEESDVLYHINSELQRQRQAIQALRLLPIRHIDELAQLDGLARDADLALLSADSAFYKHAALLGELRRLQDIAAALEVADFDAAEAEMEVLKDDLHALDEKVSAVLARELRRAGAAELGL